MLTRARGPLDRDHAHCGCNEECMRESRLQRCAPINALTPSRPGHRDKIASNDLEISRGIIARIISLYRRCSPFYTVSIFRRSLFEERNDSAMQKKKEGKNEECAFDHFDVLSSIEYLFMRESSIVQARDVVEECETGVCVKCARNSILVLTVLRFQC